MEYQTAFEDNVRTRLESSFGKAVAMLIVASASNQCSATMSGLDREGYFRLCESIAGDQRVVDMWGAAGAQEALQQWRSVGDG